MGDALWAAMLLGGICGFAAAISLTVSTDWSAATIKSVGMVVGLVVMIVAFVATAPW